MAELALLTNIDANNADDAGDPSVKEHQQQHDISNAMVKKFDSAVTATANHALVGDGTRFYSRALLSTDNPAVVINTQSGTAYTLVLADPGKLLKMTSASANAVTVPPNSSVAIPVGSVIAGAQYGAGITTLTQGAGVTINSRGSIKTTAGQFAGWTLTKMGTDEWWLEGDLA